MEEETTTGGVVAYQYVNEPTVTFAVNPPRIKIEKVTDCASIKENAIDDRERTDFEKGDLIKIRTEESMLKQFDKQPNGTINTDEYGFTNEMKSFIGKKAIIKHIDTADGEVWLKFLNAKNLRTQNYRYSLNMIEILEKQYTKKHIKEKKQLKVDEEKDEEIIKEMLSKINVRKIKRILSSCLQLSATQLKGVDKMLENWAWAKRKLYLIFGRELRMSKDIEYEATKQDWHNKIDELGHKFPGMVLFLKQLDIEDFRQNIFTPFSTSFQRDFMPNIRAGTKLTTVLSHIFKSPEFDTEFSKVISETKIHGVATISIDPIDYLLMSLNRSGWQSCHTLNEAEGRHWGCYVGGIFSYMCDNVTAIAYRHSPEEVEYSINNTKFKEFSKNWRQCIYIDIYNGNFVTSRQYPIFNENIAKIIREMLEEKVCKYFNIENSWKINRNNNFIKQYMRDYDVEDEDNWESTNALHYNDIWNDFEGSIATNKTTNIEETAIYVGDEPICPVCGNEHITDHELPMCDYCWSEIE